MAILDKVKRIFNWLNPFLNEYGILLLILFSEFILLRFFELFYLNYQFDLSIIRSITKGIYYDIVFVSFVAIIAFLPFLILFKISRKFSRIAFHIFNLIIVIVSILLIDYLKFNLIPLDHAFFAYPISELAYIVDKSIDLNFLLFSKYFISIIMAFLISQFYFKKYQSVKTIIISLIFILSGVVLTKNLNPSRRDYPNEKEFNYTLNKLSFFAKSSAKYIIGKSEISALEFNKIAMQYQNDHPEFNFHNISYPLEHNQDTCSVLGPFFNLNETPPNIVIIVMESLSSAFCGSNAYLGNFTPFLDSLINYSLYWENFLSTSERTFNAIPSITGSLPYGEKGFMQLIQDDFSVNHSSIIQILKKNEYSSNFFYGGWTSFDNMKRYFEYQNTNFILEHFSDDYTKIKKDKDGFSWGYPDKSVFKRSFEVLDSINKEPRIDMYLTLSLHHPFRPPNKEYYDSLFTDKFNKLELTYEEKQQTKTFSNILATALYTDDAIRYFFNEYKKRDDFNNTIFIITGDHRLGSHGIKNQIDIYHVPLIIYSPLLNKSITFSSVSSHANISPTFQSLLGEKYNIDIPEKSQALGMQLDTCKDFRNIHKIPFMRTNREISDYLSGNFFISDNELYQLESSMELRKINGQNILDSLKNELKRFQIMNEYITKNNLLKSAY